jgi:hypothetical protein
MSMKISKLLATTALGMSLGIGAAFAAPITGSVAVNTTGIAVTSLPISAGDQVTFSGATFGLGSPFLDTITGIGLSPSILTLTSGSTFTFASSVGNFTGANNVTVVSLVSGIGAIVVAQGTFTPDAGGPLNAYEANTMFVTLTVNQSGQAVSGSFTVDSEAPPGLIPEPMSLALFGLGLAGLGVAMRRRA